MIYNKLGFLGFLIAFGAAYGILRTLGSDEEGLWMMIAGPLLTLIDLGYRRVVGLKFFSDVSRGPAILWLPAWVWGVFLFGLGVFYHCRQG